jgi:hypothetical protein
LASTHQSNAQTKDLAHQRNVGVSLGLEQRLDLDQVLADRRPIGVGERGTRLDM